MILTSQVESLLQVVAGAAPCGSDLEYDPAFLELERLAQGKPEQQMGSAVVPGQEPDWNTIAQRAAALLGRTKDLRIALHLTRAWLNIDGFAGLRDGMAVLRGLTERYWDGVFPRLDPDDADDPTYRVNVLMGLCDSAAIIERVRALPLVISRSFGRFSLKNTDFAAFIGAQSLHKPAQYDDPDATSNAALAARLPYLFATCRFAHYLKCIVRDKIGSFKEAEDMQRWLQNWIVQYVDGDPAHSNEATKARKPLAAAEVIVEPVEGNPGYYASKFFLRPHYQLEGLTVSLRLVAKLPSAKAS